MGADAVREAACAYIEAGLSLCLVRARDKRPFIPKWNERAQAIDSVDRLPDQVGGIGLLHAWSGTCCLDIDDLKAAAGVFAARGLDIAEVIRRPGMVVSWRGNPNKLKLWFRSETPTVTYKLLQAGSMVLEFRCMSSTGNSEQDVLPPSPHPDGENYAWLRGDWRNMPLMPEDVRALWAKVERAPLNLEDDPLASAALAGPLPAQAEVLAALNAVSPENYEDWMRVALALHAAGEGDEYWEAFHAWSQRGSTYPGEAEVRRKWEQCVPKPGGVGVGTLFAKAREQEPNYRVEPPPVKSMPLLPEGYRWNARCLEIMNVAKDGEDSSWSTLVEFPVYVKRVLIEATHGTETQHCELVCELPGKEPTTYVLDMRELSRETESCLWSKGIHLHNGALIKLMKTYIAASNRMAINIGNTAMVYTKYGWQADGSFLLGRRLYTTEGVKDVSLSPDLEKSAPASDFPLLGSVEGWVKGARYFMRPEFSAQGFALLMGFAAPLMALSGERGGIYSLVGKGGQGKSTIQEAIGTIYAVPRVMHSRADDTNNARFIQLANLSSLPMNAEELTKLEATQLSALCYSVSEGRDKRRASQDGTAREEPPAWNTIVTASSNKSMLDVLFAADSRPEAARVMEDWVELPKGAKFTEGESIKRVLYNNIGVVGDQFMRLVMKDKDLTVGRIEGVKATLMNSMPIDSSQRIRVNMLACAIVAGAILVRMEVIEAETMKRLIDYGKDVLHRNMNAEKDEVPSDAFSLLADYVNEFVRQINYISERKVSLMQFNRPYGPIIGRLDVNRGHLAILIRPLRDWLLKRRSDYNQFFKQLLENQMFIGKGRNINLSAGMEGTPVQGWCMVLDWKRVQNMTGLTVDEAVYDMGEPEKGANLVRVK
ncbi:MAG: DUF927 domain-containing protein [Betaproteobacteria bacterium]|nr:DUF927 domain-containing protein [Betaproteobacteria bacterium]